jgi:signal transduction histidine kinase
MRHLSSTQRNDQGQPIFRYARALRVRDLRPPQAVDVGAARADEVADGLVGLLLVEQSAGRIAGLLLVDRMYIIATGIAAGVLASLVFYWITTRLILSPVRVLRDVTERVQSGELLVRSDLRTRDEFEQLSDTFNAMLIAFKEQQDNLRAANISLDNRLTELAQMNVDLYESAKLKGEFLASISHELRTPLNSIIGFAELLQEIAEREIPREEQTPEQTKRFRYISNIVASGRSLLDMINELLEMAKLEAGKVEVRVQPTNVGELCDLLAGLVRPQARKKKQKLTARIDPDLPLVETDPSRLRQIIFNFLSNAIKFTPEHGAVEVWATAETRPADAGDDAQARRYVRVGVTDRGPGIPEEMQQVVFEKFRQIDSGPTRGYAGTGLGLAICKELAVLLHAHIEVVTQADKGSCFMLLVPVDFRDEEEVDEMVRFRSGSPHDLRPSQVESRPVRTKEEQELSEL